MTVNPKTQTLSIFDKLYFFFIALLPIVYSNEVVDPVLIPRQLYLSLFVLIITAIIGNKIRKKEISPDFTFLKLSLPLVLIGLIVIYLVSLIQANTLSEGLYVVSKIAIEILFLLQTTYLLIHKKITISIIIKAVVVFTIVSLLIAIFQIFFVDDIIDDILVNRAQITSSFANKNLLSSILFLTIPFIVGAVYLDKKWKYISSIIIVFIALLLIVLNTRGVLLSVVISIALSALLFLRFKKNPVEKKYLYMLVSLLVMAGGFCIYFTFQSEYLHYLTNVDTVQIRLIIWQKSIQLLQDNLLFGVGAGNWKIQLPQYGLAEFDLLSVESGMQSYQRPHNDFLWVLSEIGIIGGLLYILSFIIILYYLIKLLKVSSRVKYRMWYIAFVGVVIGYMFISFVDFPMERISHQVLLYLVFSIVVAHYYESMDNEIIQTGNKQYMIYVGILSFSIILYSLIVSINRYSGEVHTQKLYKHHHKANWHRMILEADKSLNMYYEIDATAAPIEWYKGVALFSLSKTEEAQESFEKAYSVNPYHIHVLNNLGSCYEKKQEHNKAIEMYSTALSYSPTFEDARLNLSAVYFNIKEYEKAFETIDMCNVNSDHPQYNVYLQAILKVKLNMLLKPQSEDVLINKVLELATKPSEINKLYQEYRKKNIDFERYFLEVQIEWLKGVVSFSLGEVEQAQEYFQKAYDIDPEHIHVLNNLGNCYEKKQQHDKAIEMYSKALLYSPYFEDACLNLGIVYYNMKEYEKAFVKVGSCPIDSKNTKYHIYIKAILKEKLKVLQKQQSNPLQMSQLNSLIQDEDKIKRLYIGCRDKNTSFEQNILKTLQ